MIPIILNGKFVGNPEYKVGDVLRFDKEKEDIHWIVIITKIDDGTLHTNGTIFGSNVKSRTECIKNILPKNDNYWNKTFDVFLLETDEEISQLRTEVLAEVL